MSLRLFKSCALTLMLMVTFAVLPSTARGQAGVSQTCAQLGFKPGSRGHTDCVNENSGVGGRVAPKAKAPVVPEPTAAQREGKFWEDAKAIGNKEAFQGYLNRYPKGLHADLARASLARLSPTIVPPVAAKLSNSSSGTVFKDCPDCPEMVVIPAGSFEMGGTAPDELPNGE
jgi:formylglycine-generating enzyme required for sulfatase activity